MNTDSILCDFDKRIIVCSDLHGSASVLEQMIEDNPAASAVFFLGDGISDAEAVMAFHPHITFYSAAGNCDCIFDTSPVKEIDFFGKRIIFCHGHTLGVKSGLDRLKKMGKERQADLVLFGHTHIPFYLLYDGIHFFNPGSPSRPASGGSTYGVIDFKDGNIICRHIKL